MINSIIQKTCSRNLSISEQTNKAEILNKQFEVKLNAPQTEFIIGKIPYNSYICFYNNSFEDQDFIFILNGEWKFFNSEKNNIDSWNWNTDTKEIIESYKLENDFELIEEFCNGWIISDSLSFPQELESLINYERETEYLDVHLLLSTTQTKEEKALTILNTYGLSDLEKVKKILALK